MSYFITRWISLLVWLPAFFSARSQEKQPLPSSDYHLWSHLYAGLISDDCSWVMYNIVNDTGSDTLFVQSANVPDIRYPFPKGSRPLFSPIGWFACVSPAKGLGLLELKTGKMEWIPNIQEFEFTPDGAYVIMSTAQHGMPATGDMCIRHLLTKRELIVSQVSDYRVDPLGQHVSYVSKMNKGSAVQLVKLHSTWEQAVIVKDTGVLYSRLAWQRNGQSFVFAAEGLAPGLNSIYQFNTGKSGQHLYCLDAMAIRRNFKGMEVTTAQELSVSDNGQRIFFYLMAMPDSGKAQKEQLKSPVELWNVNDPMIFPERAGFGEGRLIPKLAVWSPATNRMMPITNDDNNTSFLTQDQRFAITYNFSGKEPQFKKSITTDMYVTDLATGQQDLFSDQLSTGLDLQLHSSPGGRYIGYYKQKAWWVYDVAAKTHLNLSGSLAVAFEPPFGHSGSDGSSSCFGAAGWTRNDHALIVYDAFDAWLLSTDGKQKTRLTKGREQGLHFYIYRTLYNGYSHAGSSRLPIDLSKDIILQARGADQSSGYYILRPDGQQEALVYKPAKVEMLQKAKNTDVYLFREETFERSGAIMMLDKKGNQERVAYQSNPQQAGYLWGHSELIDYKNSKGITLKAALFYPADYRPGKKYPMVVQIYQNLAGLVHTYENPGLQNPIGFNVTLYTQQGYLVLCPNISYTLGDPGFSALDCVESAVRTVTAMGIVEEQHIGLTGHSFGGYETSFIATQSKLFATAVAGASINDLVKFYLGINEEWGMTPDMWRFETQQQRFGFSFFDNQAAYIRNSPVHQVSSLQTPLLLWSGKEDGNVDWRHSTEMYLAMRRLKKRGALLLYPDEHHSLMNPINQRDLSERMLQWFNHYLKAAPAAEWILKGELVR